MPSPPLEIPSGSPGEGGERLTCVSTVTVLRQPWGRRGEADMCVYSYSTEAALGKEGRG